MNPQLLWHIELRSDTSSSFLSRASWSHSPASAKYLRRPWSRSPSWLSNPLAKRIFCNVNSNDANASYFEDHWNQNDVHTKQLIRDSLGWSDSRTNRRVGRLQGARHPSQLSCKLTRKQDKQPKQDQAFKLKSCIHGYELNPRHMHRCNATPPISMLPDSRQGLDDLLRGFVSSWSGSAAIMAISCKNPINSIQFDPWTFKEPTSWKTSGSLVKVSTKAAGHFMNPTANLNHIFWAAQIFCHTLHQLDSKNCKRNRSVAPAPRLQADWWRKGWRSKISLEGCWAS